ncbi:hypothetical protein Clacol_000024 [Clathrus columnatus]|uniref:NACHT domain-containing protein n=1 Tax=Clathrus columnatus TaxID=1419009 RepID=A0AAV4ZW81_9AGAM|nr:hypothetical protein Clacol_000024 [Clathrus columnatus]
MRRLHKARPKPPAPEVATSDTNSDSTLKGGAPSVRRIKSDINEGSQSDLSVAETTAVNVIDRAELGGLVDGASAALHRTRDLTGKPIEPDDGRGYYGQVAISVLERLSFFTSKIHPYSAAACSIITGIVTIISGARTVDQNILALLDILDNTFKLIEETQHIEDHPSYNRILSKLAKKTESCARFIQAYARDPNFLIRTGKNLVRKPIQPQIQKYEDGFAQILAELGIHLALYTEKSTAHIEENVGNLLESSETLGLSNLPYAAGAGLNTEKQCLPGTRIEVLKEVIAWVDDKDKSCPRLFWLTGPAGTGKSAIAHSVAIQFRSKGKLGSFFSFDRNYQTERWRDKVFSTIARDLADLDPQLKRELAKVVHEKSYLQSTTDLRIQWRDLLHEPLHATSKDRSEPILVIIDALDESGDEILRQDLLKILEKETSILPENVRFLVTSRPEKDITLALGRSSQWHIRTKLMDSIPEKERDRDILTYFKENLVEEDSLNDDQLKQLVGLSRGVFQWAYLALQFLKGLGNTSGLTITERYEDLIDSRFIETINNPLDAMYSQILSSLFNSKNPRVMTRFHSIIGSIIGASEPLSLHSLVTLRGDSVSLSKRKVDIKVMTQDMGSVLSGIDDPSALIYSHHVSFREYLLDKRRSKDYWIDLSLCHKDFAFGCLRTMMKELRFNICKISNSYKLNADDKGLPERVSSSISAPLSYASRFWVIHVSSTTFHPLLAKKVEEFLFHGFLMWLEVLSLLKAVNVAARLMSTLISWCSGQESHKSLYDFAVDGKRFVRLFGATIALSAPHIYLSALPFCPQDSIIYKTFIDRFPNILRVASEEIRHWPLSQRGTNVGRVACTCFSHKGEYLAVLLEDGSFKLLDSETFDVLSTKGPLLFDRERVLAVQFLADEKKSLVFATQTRIYLFNIPTGSVTRLQNINIPPSAIDLTFSQDGKFVASFHSPTLIVWNLEKEEQVISIPSSQSTDLSYSFSSSDGGSFITYDVNIGVRVWDLELGTVLHGPFKRPVSDITNNPVPTGNPMPTFDANYSRSIISQNGKHIIFINDTRLHVWNFRNNTTIVLKGSKSWIARAIISPDGDCVISESLGRITLRDMNGSKLHYDTNDHLSCTAFSEDGKRLAIGNGERLDVWELEGWQDSDDMHHSGSILNLSFVDASRDGKYFLAQSVDEKYHELWDVKLAKPVQNLGIIFFPVFSPMSRYFGYVLKKGAVKIYEIGSGITKKFPESDQGGAEPEPVILSSQNEIPYPHPDSSSMLSQNQNQMRPRQRSMSYQSEMPFLSQMSSQNQYEMPPSYHHSSAILSQNPNQNQMRSRQRSMSYQNEMPFLSQMPSQNQNQNEMPFPGRQSSSMLSQNQNQIRAPPQRSMSYQSEMPFLSQMSSQNQNEAPLPYRQSSSMLSQNQNQNQMRAPPQRSMSYQSEFLPQYPMPSGRGGMPSHRQSSMSQNETRFPHPAPSGKGGARLPPQRSMSYQSEMTYPRHEPTSSQNTMGPYPSQRSMSYSYPNRNPQRSMSYQIPGTTKQSSLPEERTERIAFSQDEMQIATLSQGTIHIWDIESSQKVDTLFLPATTTGDFKSFKGSSKFQYFGYSLSNGDISVFRRTHTRPQRISLDFLPLRSWTGSDDFTFSLDETHILISHGPTVFHMNLVTREYQMVTLRKHESDLFERRLYSTPSSNALLVEIVKLKGFKIWDAISGRLLHSGSMDYPDVQIQGLILGYQSLFTLTAPRGRVRISALREEKDDPVCFSSNRVHSIQGLPRGTSARLREDGWVITQNNELLFWVPRNHHQTLHVPRLKYIVGEKSNELDLSIFSHGESWRNCYLNTVA